MSETDSKEVSIRSQPGAVAVAEKGNGVKQKIKKTPMEEEEFTETMAKIIRRDFFPDLPKLEAQLEYIEATDQGDTVKLREISERFANEVKTPQATPSAYQTPGATPSQRKRPPAPETVSSKPKVPKPEDSKSLDAFLNVYQSEDDASFGEIMELEEEKRKQKYAWMYEREAIANELNSSIPALTSGVGPPLSVEGSDQPMAITDGKTPGDRDGRGIIKLWKYTAKNSLMYIPEGAVESAKEIIERRKEKEIRHENTRLPRDYIRKMALVGGGGVESGNVPVREKFGIDGKQVNVEASPKVNGYGFVATPQIRPGVDASPMMTWGTVEGTPLHLDTDVVATPGPVFKIPRTPQRDMLAHQLAEKASRSIKEKRKIALEKTSSLLRSPLVQTPSTTGDRFKMLSSAARKLISSPGILRGTDKALRASYTPGQSPARSKGLPPTGLTPKLQKPRGGQSPAPNASSLTDNLLDLQNNR